MIDQEATLLADAMIQFAFQQMKWRKTHMDSYFNVNGKGGCEITLRQFQILTLIHNLEINTLTQITEYLNISKSSMSLTISKLEQDGYIRKEQAAQSDDGRRIYFFVTEKGVRLINKIGADFHSKTAEFCASLSTEKRQDLKICLDKLTKIFHD